MPEDTPHVGTCSTYDSLGLYYTVTPSWNTNKWQIQLGLLASMHWTSAPSWILWVVTHVEFIWRQVLLQISGFPFPPTWLHFLGISNGPINLNFPHVLFIYFLLNFEATWRRSSKARNLYVSWLLSWSFSSCMGSIVLVSCRLIRQQDGITGGKKIV